MDTSRSSSSLRRLLSDDAATRGTWPSVLNTFFGLALLALGLGLGGPLVERVDTVLVGVLVGVVGGYNLRRVARQDREHPDVLQVAALLSLWMIAFSLSEDPAPLRLLTDGSVALGTLVFIVNAFDFGRQYRDRPDERRSIRGSWSMLPSSATIFGSGLSRPAHKHARTILYGEGLRLNLIAVVVGIVAGLGAVVFRLTIYVFQEFFFGASLNPGAISFAPVAVPSVYGLLAPLGAARYLLVPVVGGLLVGLTIRYTTTAIRGHGVPEVLEALMIGNGRIDPKIALYKTLASSIAIGSGASLGREGPIVQIGSAAGSYFGEFVDSRYTRTLVAAGAGGGIAATFNTPIAGVMFALEILLAEYYLTNVIVVVLAAVTATAVARSILGFTAAPGVHEFLVPIDYTLVTPGIEFPLYILMGVVVAFVGVGLVKFLYATEHLFLERSDLPEYVKPAIGAGLLGLSVLVTAVLLGVDPLRSSTWLFGVGYETIHESIAGQLTLVVLVVLAFMKVVGFSLSVGSGSSGGVFSPSLYVGAMVGGAFGLVVHGVVPGTAGAGAYALVGTAGVFAAAASAPLTATLIIFELTGQYTIILPLLVVTVVGSEVAQYLLNGGTIYTQKLREKGITVQERRIGSLEDLTVKDVMTTDVTTVRVGTPIEDALDVLRRRSHRGLPIVDEEENVVGILVRSDLDSLLTVADDEDDEDGVDPMRNGGRLVVQTESGEVTPQTPVEEVGVVNVVTASPHTNLLTLVDQMVRADVGRVPIVEEDGSIIGIVTRTDVLAAYDQTPIEELSGIGQHSTG